MTDEQTTNMLNDLESTVRYLALGIVAADDDSRDALHETAKSILDEFDASDRRVPRPRKKADHWDSHTKMMLVLIALSYTEISMGRACELLGWPQDRVCKELKRRTGATWPDGQYDIANHDTDWSSPTPEGDGS